MLKVPDCMDMYARLLHNVIFEFPEILADKYIHYMRRRYESKYKKKEIGT